MYFSTLGPASYDLGSEQYEDNIITDCFGKERLEEYRGKRKLDVCLVYAAEPRVLQQAPGGREHAVMIGKRTFEDLSLRHGDGAFYLREDRIVGAVLLDTTAAVATSAAGAAAASAAAAAASSAVAVAAAADRARRRLSHITFASLDDNSDNTPRQQQQQQQQHSSPGWSLVAATPFARRGLRRERMADRGACGAIEKCLAAQASVDVEIAAISPPAGVRYSMIVDDDDDDYEEDQGDDDDRGNADAEQKEKQQAPGGSVEMTALSVPSSDFDTIRRPSGMLVNDKDGVMMNVGGGTLL